MDTIVQLRVPNYIYKHAQELSKQDNRSVEDVLSDILRESHTSSLVQHPHDEAIQEEEAFFASHFEMLIEKYEGEFVAVKNGAVIDHDHVKLNLLRRIETNYQGQPVLIKLVSNSQLEDLFSSSIRWE